MKGTSKFPFHIWRKQERTREHSNGIKDEIQKWNLSSTKKGFICCIVSLYVSVRYLISRLCQGYLNKKNFFCHILSQTERRSHYLPLIDLIYKLTVLTEMLFRSCNASIKLKSQVQIHEWTESVNLFYHATF